jgi:hypothetical protein
MMDGAIGVVMVAMMVVMMGGMIVGFGWSFIRRRRGERDEQ